jgi:hypothetical protein
MCLLLFNRLNVTYTFKLTPNQVSIFHDLVNPFSIAKLMQLGVSSDLPADSQ